MKFKKGAVKGKIKGVYISKHPDASYRGDDYFVTEPRQELMLTTQGIVGDMHFGYETTSGGRFTTLYERGNTVRNNRQWLAVSPGEIEKIAGNLEIGSNLTPELMGINILIEGVDKLSDLPPMTYMVVSPNEEFKPKGPEDVVLVVYGQALPCAVAGKALGESIGDATLESRFPKGAMGLRGTTGWVEKGGIIKPDYNVFILNPTGKD